MWPVKACLAPPTTGIFNFVFLRSPKKAAKAAKAAKAPASKSSKGGGKVKKFTSAEYISNDESSGDQEAPGN